MMKHNRVIFVLALALTFSRIATAAQAQNAAKTPDLSGVWIQAPGQGENFLKDPYPMQPWAEERYKYNLDPNGHARNEMDPAIAQCFPQGPTQQWLSGLRPFEIFNVRNRVMILFEWNHEVRQIWMDGRK